MQSDGVGPVAMGVGCRRDCPPGVLEALAMTTLARAGLHLDQVTLVATLAGRQHEAAITSLAQRCHCPLMALPPEALRARESAMSHVSDTTRRVHNVPGVAEAAALAAIHDHTGRQAQLLVGRQHCDRATCALAIPVATTPMAE
ncbi:cobalt-precorrin 5A hydrolase [Kushneria avicenniae]|uniref:Cobalt-precorrin 5A hydrolase n=1 Tax=Kushneria avicenniae TaxID=402385 RepID=A0A1I1FPF4_9GAMM|nr:cobalamin biosynthesis protein [Kushneria avicenniae]SFC01317.1 cobalt-precorrin 5A hydrolase [Kushneria avicenniae]